MLRMYAGGWYLRSLVHKGPVWLVNCSALNHKWIDMTGKVLKDKHSSLLDLEVNVEEPQKAMFVP
jgi:hypothetical protein